MEHKIPPWVWFIFIFLAFASGINVGEHMTLCAVEEVYHIPTKGEGFRGRPSGKKYSEQTRRYK